MLCETEEIINSIAHTPKTLQKDMALIRKNLKQFRSVLKIFEFEKQKKNVDRATGGGAIVAAGVGALAPSVLMAIATTFGTASTGTAIASLSGAAATHAALAWIGGGAVAVGGGGMVTGNAILAATGPIGLSVAGALIVGGTVWKMCKNKKEGKKLENATVRIYKKRNSLHADDDLVIAKKVELSRFRNRYKRLLQKAQQFVNKEYIDLDEDSQDILVDLVNKSIIYSKLISWNLSQK